MVEKKKLIAVVGPTASGKTALGIALAKRLNGEIVSCDSMQVYQGLKIGTAQPSEDELAQVPHHLIGFLPWDESFSVSDYVSVAANVIGELHNRKKLPVLVGGTGLYARSLLRGFDFKEEARSEALREELRCQAQELGSKEMHNRLRALDAVSAEAIHPHNVKRVLRALEYCLLSGEPFSQQTIRSHQAEPPYRYVMFCPAYRDRQILYQRINLRVEQMLEAGLLEEAYKFWGFCETAEKLPTATQSIGYKELFPYFRGELNLDQAVENLKQESRRYAKRQITWFAREPEAQFLYMDELGSEDAVIQACMDILERENFLDKGDTAV